MNHKKSESTKTEGMGNLISHDRRANTYLNKIDPDGVRAMLQTRKEIKKTERNSSRFLRAKADERAYLHDLRT